MDDVRVGHNAHSESGSPTEDCSNVSSEAHLDRQFVLLDGECPRQIEFEFWFQTACNDRQSGAHWNHIYNCVRLSSLVGEVSQRHRVYFDGLWFSKA